VKDCVCAFGVPSLRVTVIVTVVGSTLALRGPL
jgi:hypothetical protein